MPAAPAHHHHANASDFGPVDRRVRLILAAAIVPLLVATVIGFLALRPRGTAPDISDRLGIPAELVNGTVTKADTEICPGAETIEDPVRCALLNVRLTSGP